MRNDIFDHSVVTSMAYAVGWTIENSIRSKTGSISVKLDTITPGENGAFNVSFIVNNTAVNSEWINEYGIWRIHTFGTSASGDKTLIEKKKQAKLNAERLHAEPDLQFSLGLAYPFDLGPAFGFDIKFRTTSYTALGLRGYFGTDYKQFEGLGGLYIPIKGKTVAFTPYADLGLGFMLVPKEKSTNSYNIPDNSELDFDLSMGISVQGGIMFTTSTIPGLYLQGAYQHNWYTSPTGDSDAFFHPDMIFISIGYCF